MGAVLLVDDGEAAIGLERVLAREIETAVTRVAGGAEALAAAGRSVFDVAVLGPGPGGFDSLETLPRLLAVDPELRVIVLAGRHDPRLVARAFEAGASECLPESVEPGVLISAVRRLLEGSAARREVECGRRARWMERPCACTSTPWVRTLSELRIVAGSPRTPVLLVGEAGTGKRVAATMLHEWSPRAGGPFVAVDAAQLPADILDAELFGREAGVVGPGRRVHRGLVELADRGTLLLHDIDRLPLALQPKFLRLVEGLPFRRVGGEREVRSDVRVVATTTVDLATLVRAGAFREDLFFRLQVLATRLPTLRERPGDVRALALHFLSTRRAAEEPGRELGPDVLAALESYGWPGNVRELRLVIERAQLLARGGPVGLALLPDELRGGGVPARPPPTIDSASTNTPPPRGPGLTPPPPDLTPTPPPPGLDENLEDVIGRHVLATWHRHRHNVTQTARALGIGRVALRRRLQELRVHRPNTPGLSEADLSALD